MFRDYIERRSDPSDSLTAAEHIDILTFNRIGNFEELTEFQQGAVMRAYQKLAEFERNNADILEAGINSYGINGVSMSFGNGFKLVNGITLSPDIYSVLLTTGLCYGAI